VFHRVAGAGGRTVALLLAVLAVVSGFGATFAVGSVAGAAAPAGGHSVAPHLKPRLTSADLANYWEVASDGGVFAEGRAGFYGSAGALSLNKPIVDMAATPDGLGYWMVASDGGIFNYGDARFFGSAGALALNKPIVGMAATPSANGYWLVASDGGIFSYGDAQFYGSTGALALNKPIVGMVPTPDGRGYWLVATDGGIFSYGDAQFYGSTGALVLNKPIVSMATTSDGAGYWLVASDGGIFSFGDAQFYGSTGALVLNKPIVGMARTASGNGYWLVASDGGIFNFGDAGFSGSAGGLDLKQPIVGMATQLDNVAPNTVVIPPQDTVQLVGTGGGPQDLVLAAGAPRVIPGETLVSGSGPAAPSGYLVTVASVTAGPDGEQDVTTKPAPLTDALSTAQLSYSGTLEANATPGPFVRPSLQSAHWVPGTHLDAQPFIQPFSGIPLKCNATGNTVTASGHLTFSPSFTFNVGIGWKDIIIPYVSYAQAGVGLNEAATVSWDGDVGADCKTEGQGTGTTVPGQPDKGIALIPGPGLILPEIDIQIGPIPVVIVPTLQLYLNGYAVVSVHIVATATQTFSASAGVIYKHGTFSSYSSESNSFTDSVSVGSGTAYVAASLTPQLDLLVYDASGPTIDVGVELDASATVGSPQPSPWWQLNGCLYAGAGLTVSALDLDWSDPNILQDCGRIADSGPAPPPPLVLAINSPASFSGTVNDGFSTPAPTLATGPNCAQCGSLTWGVSQNPSWLTVNAATGVLSGTPTTAGTYQATLSAHGKTAPLNSATTAYQQITIRVLPGISGIQSVASGDDSYCGVLANGSVDCWGASDSQQTGLPVGLLCEFYGTGLPANSCPVPGIGPSSSNFLSSGPPAVSVVGSQSTPTYCALLQSGGVDCWGSNGSGQLGDGSGTTVGGSSGVAVAVHGLSGVDSVAAGFRSFCAVLASGSVKCWGSDLQGQLGDGSVSTVGDYSTTPVAVSGITDARSVVTDGDETYCAVLDSGGVDCWGNDAQGGDGDLPVPHKGYGPYSAIPKAVPEITSATSIVASNQTFCAALASGGVVCWGNNQQGQAGTSSTVSTTGPVPLAGITTARSVSASSGTFCALLSSGHVDCWGANSDGSLGDGSTTPFGGSTDIPEPVSGLTSAVTLSADAQSFCAVETTGTAVCWGDDSDGELGNGTFGTSTSPVPVSLAPGTMATAVVSDQDSSSCALSTVGGVECWGNDLSSELGDGKTTDASTPQTVSAPGVWGPPPT